MRKTLKRILGFCLVLCLILSLFTVAPLSAGAAETGTAGDITWSFDEDTHTLTISGNGAMPDYEFDSSSWTGNRPWEFYSFSGIVIEDGVTRIGDNAFTCSNIFTLELPASVKEVGTQAFANCGNLMEITVLGKDTQFADNAFDNSFLKPGWGSRTFCCYPDSTVSEYAEKTFGTEDITYKYFGEYQVYYCSGWDKATGDPQLLEPVVTSSDVPYTVADAAKPTNNDVFLGWKAYYGEIEYNCKPGETITLYQGDALYLTPIWGYTIRFMDGDKCVGEAVAPYDGVLNDIEILYPQREDTLCTGYATRNGKQYVNLNGWTKDTADEEDIEDSVLTLYAQFSDEAAPPIRKSLTLTGSIGLNFYLEGDYSDSEMQVVGTWKSQADRESGFLQNGSYFERSKLTVNVFAKNMTDKITVNVTYKNAGTPIGWGIVKYSVADYCNAVIGVENDSKLEDYYRNQGVKEADVAGKVEELKTLCKSMLNYGAQAQRQFGYNTDDLADANIGDYTPIAVDTGSLNDAETDDNLYPGEITYYGSTIGLLSDPYYMVILESPLSGKDDDDIYINITTESSENFYAGYSYRTVNGEENVQTNLYSYVMHQDPDGYSYEGIPITKLLDNQTIWISDFRRPNSDDPISKEFTFNPGAYIKRVLEKSDDAQLRATVTALYDYSVKAKAYFSNYYD